MTPQNFQKQSNLMNFDPLWAWQNLCGYGRKVHAKSWPWGMPWEPIYCLVIIKINLFWSSQRKNQSILVVSTIYRNNNNNCRSRTIKKHCGPIFWHAQIVKKKEQHFRRLNELLEE